MGKHLTIIKAAYQRGLAYRSTIILYRLGEVLEIIFLFFLWSAIFRGHAMVGGYSFNEMITYVIIGSLVSLVTRNFLAELVAYDIREGRLSLFLTRPITYFRFVLTREIGRITLPLATSLLSQMVVFFFLRKHLILTLNAITAAAMVVMVVLAFIIEALLSFLIGLTAFWSDEIDGFQALMFRLRKFFAGGLFPLSLLPPALATTSMLLPFSYSFFMPTQLYLNKLSLPTAMQGIGIEIAWIVVLYILVRVVWNKGTKRYEGVGI